MSQTKENWSPNELAKEVDSKLNAGLLAVSVVFCDRSGMLQLTTTTNRRPVTQRPSEARLRAITESFDTLKQKKFALLAIFTAAYGRHLPAATEGWSRLSSWQEANFSVLCECRSFITATGQFKTKLLYEHKLRRVFVKAATDRKNIEEVMARGGIVLRAKEPVEPVSDPGSSIETWRETDWFISNPKSSTAELFFGNAESPQDDPDRNVSSTAPSPNSALYKDRSADSPPSKPGRNEPCPCSSGEKYKKCCGDESLKAMLIDDVPYLPVELPQQSEERYEELLAIIASPDIGKIDADNLAADNQVMKPGALQTDILKAGGMPPYPATWIETGKILAGESPARIGILALHDEHMQEIDLSVFIELGTSGIGNPFFSMLSFARLSLDDSWDIAQNPEFFSGAFEPGLIPLFDGDRDRAQAFAGQLCLLVKVSFAMLNWDRTMVPHQTVKRKRKIRASSSRQPVAIPLPKPKIEPFHKVTVLDVTRLKLVSRSSSVLSSSGKATEGRRRHTVRASLHWVKRPLFGLRPIPGKTIGLIRVKAHTRGNPGSGSVNKIYRPKNGE